MPHKWITIRNVPILDEHEIKDDEGNTVVVVDKTKLQKIARNNNRRVAETGDTTPVVIGHTFDPEDKKPETEQPPVVGFAKNFRVRKLFKTNRYAIHSDWRIPAQYADDVRKYPRRSVELWLSDWRIDPISLLGATTPERDLGVLKFNRSGQKKYSRVIDMPLPNQPAAETPSNTPVDKSLVQGVVAALQETDVWKFLKSQMDQAQQAAQTPAPAQDPNSQTPLEDEGDPTLEGDEGDLDDLGDEDFEDEDDDMDEDEELDDEAEDDEDEEPVRYSGAQCALPSGSNTYIPTGPKVKNSKKTSDKVRLTRDGLRTQLAQYQRAFTRQERINQHLLLKLQRAEREKDLIQLESEGLIFDRAEELEDVTGMDPRRYQKHIEKMRVRYQKAPLGDGLDRVLGNSRQDISKGLTKERQQELQKEAIKRGISFEAILEEMEGNSL